MKTCPSCRRYNDDGNTKCIECGRTFAGEAKPKSVFAVACAIAGAHFLLCCILGFMAFAGAVGQGLSDGAGGTTSSVPNILAVVVGILEAPVVLTQWVAIKSHLRGSTGLDFQTLFLISCVWSAVVGWISAVMFSKRKRPL